MAGRRRSRGAGDLWRAWRRAKRTYRFIRACWRTLTSSGIVLFCLVVLGYLWKLTGSLYAALEVALGVCGLSVGLWLGYRYLRTGLTPRESSQQLWRQRRTAKQWAKACKTAGLPLAPKLWRVRSEGEDVTALIYAGQQGITRKTLARSLETLADVTLCREVTIRPRGHSGKYDVRFSFGDVLSDVIRPTDVPTVAAGSVAVGLTDDGIPYAVPVLNTDGEAVFVPTLVGGLQGSGKSGYLWALLAGFIAAGIPLRLRVIDPGGGTEFAALRRAFEQGLHTDTFRVHSYTSNPKDAEKVFAEAVSAMNARLYTMGRDEVRLHKPTVAEPYDLVIVDEALRIKALLKKGTDGPVGDLMSQGRKASHGLVALAQIGHAATLGEARELFPTRVVFRTRTREQTETIVGSGGLVDLMPAHRIPKNMPGQGYALDELAGDEVVRFRTMRITDAMTKAIAAGELPSGMAGLLKPVPVPCAVYRIYAHDGRLLYVGKSVEPVNRLKAHARSKDWWGEVNVARHLIVWFDDEATALTEEERAIKAEGPVYNDQHNHDNPLRLVRDDDDLVAS
jgi:hypothetical protein